MKVGVITSVFFPLIDNAYKFYGGMEIRTLSLIEYLSQRGHDVHVFATKDSSLHIKNVTLHTGNYPIWDGKRLSSYDTEKDIIVSNLDILKSCDAVIEDNHFHYYNYLASKKGFKQNVAMSWDFYPNNLKVLPPTPRNVLCVSKWLRNEIRDKFAHAGHKIYYAYSGLNLDYYKPFNNHPSFDGPILFLNRFSHIKGGHIFLQLAKDMPDEEFLMMGDVLFTQEGTYAWKLKQIADDMPNVKVIFNASWEEKINALQTCKFLVHPCIVPEPLGLDCLEAQYLGKYVIGFAMGGLLETVKEGKTGSLVFPERNSEINYKKLKERVEIFTSKEPNPKVCIRNVEENFNFKKFSAPVYEAILMGKSEDEIHELERKQNAVVI
ncbi:MAG: hypothetical protein FHOMOCKG_00055 [Methanophagales virus GBV302]|uniref:Glycosyltransferase n=1 Tax=Methanophagales virus GBV302 TaxID=2999281 RepID=A0A9E8VBQ7_9CAUD|nr:MAG: hypothetical protein QIT37_gp055 [Methanophagales virus GBV302]WAE39583.1 MAG: hypothetical protein FHOMOCKG_00055 [Methanophagales virus GBV302]